MSEYVDPRLLRLATRLGDILEKSKLSIATAESCTGGWIAHILTSVPTSSSWFERGFIAYSEASKQEVLHIKKEVIEQFGPVSQEVASDMARGALYNSKAQVAIAVTGLAGPASDEKSSVPIGSCWFAWAVPQREIITTYQKFEGDRININIQAVETAMKKLIKILKFD